MTPTCSVRMWNKSTHRLRPALVLIELLLVLGLIALMTSIAMLSFSAVAGKSHFHRKAQNLVTAFQSAWNTAQQSDRRYAIVLSFTEKTWVLRQFAQLDFEGIPEDQAVIKTGTFDDRFQLDYVLYDDLQDTREQGTEQATTEARFYAGHGGWQCGGKVVLRDEDGNSWSIVVYRIGKPVELLPGDVSILIPQESKAMPF
jgi:type II secretory pathway pseudopilin PulG